jgi:hypothetical protein
MKRLFLAGLLAAASASASIMVQSQALACLDYNINHNNCSSAFSGTLTSTGETLSFSDIASSSYGIMHVSTSDSFTVNGNQAWSYGFVAFQDVLTVNSAGHQGQTGYINLGYFVDGTVSSTGVSDGFNQVVMRVTTSGLQNWVDDIHASTAGSVYTHLFQITYGTPFTLYFSMQATGGTAVDSGTGYSFVNKTGSGTSNVNFSNTFDLDQLTTLGSDQTTVLNDTTFDSESGTAYSQSGVALTPEPGTLLLGFTGLLAVIVAARRRRPAASC